ncbi:hypothetical protein N7516_009791 [Penicillium verrucosum]|uniref:uncharacterized protein n=1 Tax=Penicillium verrucosum TaxID=60171 RepID=UPI0025453FEC|nr:uncharacterized protein N7516_009791 [Penicillium verrucosum]KAJ5922088.1 hypothetical protein N7516_009791 [Penicillium verrucosum]
MERRLELGQWNNDNATTMQRRQWNEIKNPQENIKNMETGEDDCYRVPNFILDDQDRISSHSGPEEGLRA